MSPRTLALSILAAALAAACATNPTPQPAPWDAALLDIARDYPHWPRVSDSANFAPTDCRVPAPSGVLRSRSGDEDTHGRKLYFLFAKQPNDYRFLADPSPVGQAIVKQSWSAVEVPATSVPQLPRTGPMDRAVPAEYRAERRDDGDHWFRTGEQRELFVMLKLDPATPGTDEGWVYATVAADGSRVLASGRLPSCMKCHAEDTTDRLFGMYRRPKRG